MKRLTIKKLKWRACIFLLLPPWAVAQTEQPPQPDEQTEQADQVESPVERAASAAVPSDEELETAQARIGDIEIRVGDVFDTANPRENKAPYRLANFLHIDTRDGAIRAQLLFKSGQVYSRHVLDETARNLRSRHYLNDASVEPLRYDTATNTVDVLVKVRDVWTLNPGASYGRSGGVNHSGLQLEEGNLLGYGKSLSLGHARNVDRNVWQWDYYDPNVLSSRWELNARYADASDGGLKGLNIAHPFYALDTRWGATVDATHEERIGRRYEMGAVTAQYRLQREAYGAQFGWSAGLRDGWVRRWWLGYRIEHRHFEPVPLDTMPINSSSTWAPPDVNLAYPLLTLNWLEDRYEVQTNRDQVGRTEDVYYGRNFAMTVGYAAPFFGADRRAWMINTRIQDGYHLGERQSLFGSIGLVGRLEHGDWRAMTLLSNLRYDYRWNRRALFTASVNDAYAKRPDPNQQLYLGGEDGMRGYPLHFRSGTHTTLLSLEQRAYTDWQILRLLTVGGAVFFDVGHVGGRDSSMAAEDGAPHRARTFKAVGLGLRLGNIRSSSGEVFHIDIARPLDAVAGHDRLQLVISTKQSF